MTRKLGLQFLTVCPLEYFKAGVFKGKVYSVLKATNDLLFYHFGVTLQDIGVPLLQDN
jgi:hypothetical protein